MGVAIGATKVDLDRVPHPDSDTVVSIVLSVLMVTSMVGGAAFVGTQSFSDSEAGGTVSAQEYNSQSLIFSVSSDDSLRAINSSMGSQVWRFDGHTSSLTTVAVTPDKSTVFSGGFDNTIKAVDTTSGEEIWSFNNHRDTVREVSLSGDGSILYSVSDDGTVRGIDAGSGAQLWKYENGGRLISVEPLSSSNSVLYGTAGGTVKRLNIDGMNISWSEGLHSSSSDEVDAIEQSIGGSVYSGAGDGTVKIDPFSGNITWVYDNIGPVNDISVSNSGIYIAYDGGVKSLNSSGGQIWSYNDYADNVRSISASQVDDVVYTGTGNGTIKAINTTSVSSIWSFTGHGLGVNAIAAAPPSIQPDPPFPGWEDTAPLIRAVDQNGDPVETRRSRRGPSKPKASLTKSRTKRHARRKSSTSWTTSNPISGRHRHKSISPTATSPTSTTTHNPRASTPRPTPKATWGSRDGRTPTI